MSKSTNKPNTSKYGNGTRAGLGSIMAFGILHFLIDGMLDSSTRDPETAKVIACIGIGIGVIGFIAALYAVFGVVRHRSLIGFVAGGVGGWLCGSFLWGVIKAFMDANA